MMTVKIKKQKAQKMCQKETLRFENYKKCLEVTQLENKKIIFLLLQEFMKNNKLI